MPITHRKLNNIEYSDGIIIYKMSRDQRASDNRSLLYCMDAAKKNNTSVAVVFILQDDFLNATNEIFDFMLLGLMDTKAELDKLNIPFYLIKGNHKEVITKIIDKNKIGMLVTDFDPLRIKQQWNKELLQILRIPFVEVDSHNVVPAFIVSDKQEFAAYTIRPKIHRLLNEYLTEFPNIEPMENKIELKIPDSLEEYELEEHRLANKYNIIPTEAAAIKILKEFITNKLNKYNELRNQPDKDYISNLSPYLHFGKISAQRVAIEVMKSDADAVNKDAFIEELIVRKELADNFCLYNSNYDNFVGFPDWAKKSLDMHRADKREYIYSLERIENSETHDQLWNAANNQMIKTGKMHGYLRMYWAKKILEWTAEPEEALEYAIYLNDKYSIDGRDPNGYTGIAWSIGGVHDRAWFERAIFGKVRYMSYNSQIKKFDAKSYIAKNI